MAFLAEFTERLPDRPAFAPLPTGLTDVLARPPGPGPSQLPDLLDLLRRMIESGADMSSGRNFAYTPGGGLFTAALGEFLAAATNRYVGLSGSAPAAAALEHGIIRWLCDLFALPPNSGGVLTSGGSLAGLYAMVAARHDHLGDSPTGATFYVTAHTHPAIIKAARIAGLPADAARTVAHDRQLQMDVSALAEAVRRDRADGRRPFMIVATAGTAATGAIDPLPELAALARHEDLWLHIDACYGGFFYLTGHGRHLLDGISEGDSLSVDAHKSLFLPYGTGALLVRDTATLRRAFTQHVEETADQAAAGPLTHFADLGAELTRDFRGLRLWLPLHLHGTDAFRDGLQEKLDLAQWIRQQLAAHPALDLPWPAPLTTVTFHVRDTSTAQHRHLVNDILDAGHVNLTSMLIDHQPAVRLCVLNHRTHHTHTHEAVHDILTHINRHQHTTN